MPVFMFSVNKIFVDYSYMTETSRKILVQEQYTSGPMILGN